MEEQNKGDEYCFIATSSLISLLKGSHIGEKHGEYEMRLIKKNKTVVYDTWHHRVTPEAYARSIALESSRARHSTSKLT